MGAVRGTVRSKRAGLSSLPRRIKLPAPSTPFLSLTNFRVLKLPSLASLSGGAAAKKAVQKKKKAPRAFSDQTMNLFYGARKRVVNPIRDYRDWSWAADLMFPTRVGRDVPVFCAIELTTRLGFACITKRDAKSTVTCLNKLRTAVGSDRIKHFAFDQGVEFTGAPVKAWVKKQCGEEPWYYDSGSSSQKGLIERFNFVVRARLEMYKAENSPFWTQNTLDTICEDYNVAPHKSLKGASPEDAAGSGQEPELLRALVRTAATAASQGYRQHLDSFKPGDRVRVHLSVNPLLTPKQQKAQKLGKKFGQRWSSEVYTVERVGSATPLPADAATTKPAGFYVTLQGVGSSTVAGARRFSPANLQKVESPAPAPGKEVRKGSKALAGFKTQADKARHDARVARFLKAQQLDEAASAHKRSAAATADAQETALKRAFAAEQSRATTATAPPPALNARQTRFAQAARADNQAVAQEAKAEAALLAKGREALRAFFSTKQGQAARQAVARRGVELPAQAKAEAEPEPPAVRTSARLRAKT